MSRCYGCMKYGVIYVATVFLIFGLITLILPATYLITAPETYLELSHEDHYNFSYGKWIIVGAGLLMVFAGIFGCCGGFKQSPGLLSIFFAIILMISMAELAAGVYSYLYKEEFIQYFNKLMTNSIHNAYDRDEYQTKAWDHIQITMQCCGAENYKDYNSNVNHNTGSNGAVDMTLSAHQSDSYTIPESCCVQPESSECTKAIKISTTSDSGPSKAIHSGGCAAKVVEWIESKSIILIGILIGIGGLQILCLLCTCVLICAFRGRSVHKN